MELQTTPVKTPIKAMFDHKDCGEVIRRPSMDKQRRVSAPIKEVPETRIAPEQIVDAPKVSHSRRSLQDQTVFLSPPPSAAAITEGEETKENDFQTPRRRSCNLIALQKTPTAPVRRLNEEVRSVSSRSFGSLAPVRSQRVEVRQLFKAPDVVKMPLF